MKLNLLILTGKNILCNCKLYIVTLKDCINLNIHNEQHWIKYQLNKILWIGKADVIIYKISECQYSLATTKIENIS